MQAKLVVYIITELTFKTNKSVPNILLENQTFYIFFYPACSQLFLLQFKLRYCQLQLLLFTHTQQSSSPCITHSLLVLHRMATITVCHQAQLVITSPPSRRKETDSPSAPQVTVLIITEITNPLSLPPQVNHRPY